MSEPAVKGEGLTRLPLNPFAPDDYEDDEAEAMRELEDAAFREVWDEDEPVEKTGLFTK